MKLLKEKKLPFGVSCCYTSANCDSISSDEFYDWLVDKGVLFAWYFHYMPVGNDAVPQLMPTPAQREMMYDRVRYCDVQSRSLQSTSRTMASMLADV